MFILQLLIVQNLCRQTRCCSILDPRFFLLPLFLGRLLLCILLPFLVLLPRGVLERMCQAAFGQFRCTLFQNLNVLGVGGIDDDNVGFFIRLVTLPRN